MSSRRIVIGNWKMNPASIDEAKRIARKTRLVASRLERTDVVACPPFPFIHACVSRKLPDRFHIGAQDVSVEEGGAHTGEASAYMVRSLGAEYAIIGHSERRASGETDETVAKKAMRAIDAGMTAVVCVGEKAREESGSHFDIIKEQIKGSLAGIPEHKVKNVMLAYEPVWAIGAQEAMAATDINEMSIFAKKTFADIFGSEAGLKVKVLYGGAVNFRNAREIVTIGRVDGLLVGRESVNMPGFTELLKAVDQIQ